MADENGKKESKVENTKKNSRRLRGTIAESLASNATHFEHDDGQLLKFHGIYQQDNRDLRRERTRAKQEPEYIFMVRTAIPGGLLNAEQYLALDQMADEFGNGTLRITTRQGFQFHEVYKRNLKSTVAEINKRLLTTLSACGDVERNVMTCPAPLADEAHHVLQRTAREIAVQLRPASRAYHEIWLGEEKLASTEEKEPFYGEQYLPRKFKTGIALDSDNCIDVLSYDCGLIAIVEEGRIRGYNVAVGGGMGMSHGKADTFGRLADLLGFIGPQHAVEAVRTVAGVFRDHGNRQDRKHARLKYLLEAWGMQRFRREFRKRVSFDLRPPLEIACPPYHDHLGRHPQGDGKWFYGLFVENGRIVDLEECRIKSALRAIIRKYKPGVRLTSSQNILLTDLEETSFAPIEQVLRDHGVAFVGELTAARRYSMACPALPTCGLAITESERAMPGVVDRFEAELERLGVSDVPLTLRMTGCPNGCARPYTADIAFVGRKPGEQYNVYVGGGLNGDRVADLFAEDVPIAELLNVVRPLLERWVKDRRGNEGLSDYYQRLMGDPPARRKITGAETPTRDGLAPEVIR